jgi:hypothetical protein
MTRAAKPTRRTGRAPYFLAADADNGYSIRRIDAGAVLRNLQEPAIKVADGVAAAASVHLRSLFIRLRVVNRELQQAEAKLDALCAAIGEAGSNCPAFSAVRPASPPTRRSDALPHQAAATAPGSAHPSRRGSVG